MRVPKHLFEKLQIPATDFFKKTLHFPKFSSFQANLFNEVQNCQKLIIRYFIIIFFVYNESIEKWCNFLPFLWALTLYVFEICE